MRLKTEEENGVVNGVKGCSEAEHDKDSEVA